MASAPERLSPLARDTIAENADALFVSAISAFEIGVKVRRGKLELPLAPGRYFARAVAHHGVREVPVDSAIASASTELPTIHADPCDRLIIATAQLRQLVVLTPDEHIHAYPDMAVVW